MRDAIGGVLVIEIVIVFLLIVNSYLAFSVNYTKAFRVKNRIISIIENHEGLHVDDTSEGSALSDIEKMMLENHYSINDAFTNNCSSLDGAGQYHKIGNSVGGFCTYIMPTSETGSNEADETYKGAVYSVAVFVNIDLPVLNRIFPYFANVFAIKGETKTIYSSGAYTELSGTDDDFVQQ